MRRAGKRSFNHDKASSGEWSQVCRQMEAAFKQSNYEEGVLAGVQAVVPRG